MTVNGTTTLADGSDKPGVRIHNSATEFKAEDGDITITGTSSAADAFGVDLASNASVAIQNSGTGSLSITGNAPTTGGIGVGTPSGDASLSTNGGTITLHVGDFGRCHRRQHHHH